MTGDDTALAIERVLDEHVRPAIASHGGAVAIAVHDDHVLIEMRGSCGSCYFRRGCSANLVRPAIEDAGATLLPLRFRGSPMPL